MECKLCLCLGFPHVLLDILMVIFLCLYNEDYLSLFFCFIRSGIQLARKDSKALVLPSTVVLIAVFLYMMLIQWSHLTTLTTGEKNSLFRFAICISKLFSKLLHLQILLWLLKWKEKNCNCGDDMRNLLQASPSDPENFPFVVLGNKIDVDSGNSRVVRLSLKLLLSPPLSCDLCDLDTICDQIQDVAFYWFSRFQRKKLELGVHQREIFHTLRPLPRKVLMWKKPFSA